MNKLLKEEIAIKSVILNPNPSMMKNRISRALRWTGMATQETDEADRILKYVTALECLFIKEWHGKAKLLAKRVATIWTNDYGKRDKIYKDIHRLYKLRNDIVHGGSYTVTNKDRSTMDHVACNLVFEVAQIVSVNNFLTINDLLAWLKSKKGAWIPPPV